jgi:hypothetical protein
MRRQEKEDRRVPIYSDKPWTQGSRNKIGEVRRDDLPIVITREEKNEDVGSKYLDKPWEQGERRRVGDPKYKPHDDAWWAERRRESIQRERDYAIWKFKETAPEAIAVSLIVCALIYMAFREFEVIQYVFGTPYIVALIIVIVGCFYIRFKE